MDKSKRYELHITTDRRERLEDVSDFTRGDRYLAFIPVDSEYTRYINHDRIHEWSYRVIEE